MGVPKFFRYTSERYPCLNELVKAYQIPDFDNMYLDMNGIIHNCSHPDDSNPHFRITEEKIFQDIFHYLSILFQIIKPKKLFFMAIDGVAPRAKMNQQRGRRFRSAREAEKLEEEARKKGEVLPSEKRFDSNCITPGTVFMARLHEQLRFFVQQKISTDPLWSKVKVILSGHETPGEGEHKIMDYIRWARSQPDYDPDTRHCLYGLDADLIMLGMCTHEPHFALLREEVKFGKTTQRATSPEETNFFLLHLSLLREYLEQEFISIKHNLPFKYDIEKVVDDWVLMGFLVGNDFIPNLPNMHISNDALPILYSTYMKVLPMLDGYINEAGELNLKRFEIFMQELAKLDKEKFQDTYADLKYFEAKTGRRPNANERKEYKPNNDDTFNVNIDDIKANKPDDELQALIDATHDMFIEDVDGDDEDYEDIDSSDEEANFNMEFKLHKKDYYMNKLDYSKVTEEVLASQAEGYVRAIQWNLHYYYHGCPSWCWYYPHHYAPYISDIKGFSDLKITFEKGEPFKPFEQLLAVLPSASKQLLPAPFHSLMTHEESPIVHYYPQHFETDLNGKKNDWEAVVLIPFIDEVNLLSAMAPCYQRLTDEERRRNSHGPMMVYNWTAESRGLVPAPDYFPPITDCHATETPVFREELEVPLHLLKKGMLLNVEREKVFPGFPTMRHLKYRTHIKKNKVKVFDQPSRNENMIVEIIRSEPEPSLEAVARQMLGQLIWVQWPHLTRAKVISVSNEKQRLHLADNRNGAVDGGAPYTVELNVGNLHKQWISERSTVIEHNMGRLGIELGDVNILVHAVNLKGYKYLIEDNTRMVLEPEWCSVSCGHALQATVDADQARTMHAGSRFSTPQEAYPPGHTVFLLTPTQYYGQSAKVIDSESIRSGRIKVLVTERQEPVPTARTVASPYMNANHAAASCGITTALLSRITGSVFVVPGARHSLPTDQLNKTNVGLNLKFNKKNMEVSGYTRRCPLTSAWLYSRRCVALVSDFARRFPELIDQLSSLTRNDVFFEQDLWPNNVGEGKLQEVQSWLKEQPHTKALKRECGSEALEASEMKQLWESLEPQLQALQQKQVTLHVKWTLLYNPDLHSGNISPDPKADFKLYDRVVNVTSNITVPLGATGTITAVYRAATNTVRLADKLNAEPSYQIMFDEPFPGGMTEELFEEPRFYRLQPYNLLNLSFGRNLRSRSTQEPADSFLPTTTLRRGPHSAFASYSPTKDRQTPIVEPRITAESRAAPRIANDTRATARVVENSHVAPAARVAEDSSTELLKSLLKISQDDPDKKANKPTAPEPPKSWRSRSEAPQPAPPPPPQIQTQRPQNTNWRTENSAAVNNKAQPTNEWVNKNYKGAPPVPPFPTFGQPLQGPGPAQVPFPQFNNPHFQQRNHDNYNRPPHHQNNHYNNPHFGNQSTPNSHFNPNIPNNFANQNVANISFGSPNGQNNFGNQNSNFGAQNNQFGGPKVNNGPVFPKHLPAVNSSLTLAPPNYQKGQGVVNVKPEPAVNRQNSTSSDKTNNPFVPLQVQASQRRGNNPSHGSSHHRRTNNDGPTAQEAGPPRTTSHQKPHQETNASSKPQRKRKPRIAANLPFQTE
ncbi:hypothetical protein JYU34_016922 [Plutella xylostella]|uniref:5'-3' exoribonuclease 1 n=1 Tax=Plutella xylostella TaxID=51655 RepID=A0ABQ7Q5C0_PLUXY|nr:hypothetical protein JYU34_016922 [Plutella xylostella]